MVATHALPTPPAIQRPRVLMIGTAFASAASAMFFVGLIGIYLTRRADLVTAGNTWLPKDVKLELAQPNMMLFTLLASVVTMQWAVYAIARNDRRHTYMALGITFLFGMAFVNEATYLYQLAKFDVTATPQAVLFYTITGAHIIMLMIAMVFVGLMAFRALAGQQTSRQHDGISSAALFWQVMVAVYALIWISIFVTK